MSKASRSVPSRRRRKKVLRAASGYVSSRRYTVANERVAKALQYQYMHRKERKREMRSLWIARINAGLRELGQKYSVFISKLNKIDNPINRKMLSKLAMEDKNVFTAFVDSVNKKSV